MNEEQFAAWLAEAFRLIELETRIEKATAPSLLSSLARIRSLVELLPDESLVRERAWREIYPRMMQELQSYGDEFAYESITAASSETGAIAIGAQRQLALAGVVNPAAPAAITLAGSVQQILNATKVGENTLRSIFGKGEDGLSLYVRSQAKHIDRIVREGILMGTTTQNIAERIVQQRAQSGGLPPLVSLRADAARRIRSEANTMARTIVQAHAFNVHDEVYKANEDQLDGLEWEFVATLDSRTCPTCAPLDGKREKKRIALPDTPIHPNCRCRVVAVDPTEKPGTRTGQEISSEPFSYKGKTWAQMNEAERIEASAKAGLYASKTRGKSTRQLEIGGSVPVKFNRRAKQLKPEDGKAVRYSDFIYRANAQTKLEFFGGLPEGVYGKPLNEQRKYVARRRMDAFDRAMSRPGADSKRALEDALKVR